MNEYPFIPAEHSEAYSLLPEVTLIIDDDSTERTDSDMMYIDYHMGPEDA